MRNNEESKLVKQREDARLHFREKTSEIKQLLIYSRYQNGRHAIVPKTNVTPWALPLSFPRGGWWPAHWRPKRQRTYATVLAFNLEALGSGSRLHGTQRQLPSAQVEKKGTNFLPQGPMSQKLSCFHRVACPSPLAHVLREHECQVTSQLTGDSWSETRRSLPDC